MKQAGYVYTILYFVTLIINSILATEAAAQSAALSPTSDVPLVQVLPEIVAIPVVPGDDIRFRRLSLSQGLSQTRVAQIVQDDQGFIWFGTQHGLNSFDAYVPGVQERAQSTRQPQRRLHLRALQGSGRSDLGGQRRRSG